MKTNEIQELFDKHTEELTYTDNTMRVMNADDFADAINQAELEWYKKLEKRLNQIMKNARQGGNSTMVGVTGYQFEIQNKIKELENNK